MLRSMTSEQVHVGHFRAPSRIHNWCAFSVEHLAAVCLRRTPLLSIVRSPHEMPAGLLQYPCRPRCFQVDQWMSAAGQPNTGDHPETQSWKCPSWSSSRSRIRARAWRWGPGRALYSAAHPAPSVVNAYTPGGMAVGARHGAASASEDESKRVMDRPRPSCPTRISTSCAASPRHRPQAHSTLRQKASAHRSSSSDQATAAPWERAPLGTVTQEVRDASPCAVMRGRLPVSAATTPLIRLARIGVGFDDTPQAHDALAIAPRGVSHEGRAAHRLGCASGCRSAPARVRQLSTAQLFPGGAWEG